MTTADGEAGYEGDDDFGHRADETLEVEDVEPRYAIITNVATLLVAPDFLVAAGTEGELAVMLGVSSAQEYDADRGVVAGVIEGLEHLGDRVWREGVATVGPVDGYASHAVGLLVDDVDEVSAFKPTNVGLHDTKLAVSPIFSNE